MSLAGMVLAGGAARDDAIIDIENIVRRLRQRRLEGSGLATASIILDASVEVRTPIVFATLIDVTTLVPIFFVAGLTGALFAPLALSYGLAVLASMLVALTVTPALGLILLRSAPLERRESPLVGLLQRGYRHLLGRALRAPLRVAAVGIN